MKTIKSLMTIVAILALSFGVQAQDADNRYTFSVGFTGVDAFPTNATNDYAGSLFQDFFKVGDNWNVGFKGRCDVRQTWLQVVTILGQQDWMLLAVSCLIPQGP